MSHKVVLCLALCAAGCDQAMSEQPKRRPLQESRFFPDGRSSRSPVPGTVPQGELLLDRHLTTGMIGTRPADWFPFAITREILERGRERFDIFCSPCHDRTGSGGGRIVQRGFRPPPSLHIDRLRRAPVGHFFDVITRGIGAMSDYEAQISVRDRWAIVAYVRALQESQNASAEEVPADVLRRLEAQSP